jgi:phospholipid/cholesterol/gamma-HCH transport system substrate-binding protein
METKANHLVIGGFVLLMVGAAFAFVYWIENFMNGGSSRQYHVVFNGSVQGLAEAGGVLFNGLRVGSVKSLAIMPEDTRKVRAVIAVAEDTPVRENSRARISQQGLAGWVALEITPGTPDSPILQAKAGEALPVIEADLGGAGGSVMSAVPEALGNANALFSRLNEMVASNQDLVHRTAKNIESFTGMLDQNKDDISAIIKDARGLSSRFTSLADKLEGAVDQVTGGDNSVVAQAQAAATSFRKLAEKLDKTLGDQADGLTQQAKRSLREFESFMRDGRRMADSLDRVLQKVENNPSSIIFGGSQVPEYKPGQQ